MFPIALLQNQNVGFGGWQDYARLMFVLGGILILAFLTVRVWLPRIAHFKAISSGPIKVVAQLPLEARKTLYVVKAGSSTLLVASSETGVHFMTTLASGDFAERTPEAQQRELNQSNFLQVFRSFQNRRK